MMLSKHYFFGLCFLLFANVSFAETNDLACDANAGPDQLLTCVSISVTLDGSGSSTGPDVIYTWSGPGITPNNMNEQSPDVTEPGVYNLNVENTTDGCNTDDEVIVVEDFQLPLVIIQPTDVITCDNFLVTLDGSGSSIGPNFVYEWYEWNGNLMATTLTTVTDVPGTYTLVVTNTDNGCISQSTIDVPADWTIPNPIVSASPLFVCASNPTATFDASGSWGGSGPLSFEWVSSTGIQVGNGPILDVNDLDVYTLVLTDDANGCTSTLSVIADEVMDMEVEYIVTQAATCGACDGSVELLINTPSGGGPFMYEWSDPAFGGVQNPTGFCEGSFYSVTVTGVNNACTVVLDIPDFFSYINLDLSSTYADCGINDGTATVTVLSGSTDPTYTWSNGTTTQTNTGLAPGGYSVTVEDAITGCTAHQNIIVEQDPACQVHISGYVYDDETDMDCDDTSVDGGVYNIMVKLSNGDITFTDINGYYEFTADPGSYEISINLNTPQYVGICIDTITVDLPVFGSVSENNNFYIINNGIQDLNIKVVKWPARPGFEQHIIICAMNFGDSPIDGTVVFMHDPIQDLVNTSGPGVVNYNESTSTVEWEFDNLPPGAVWVYHAYLYLDPSVPLGTELDFSFILEPLSGDINPSNNVIACSSIVTGSYDPNDKRAIPGGESEKGYILREDSLVNYTIRFQNTGTDTAFTVVIRDTLDVDLDMNTLVPLPSCRPYSLDVISDRVLEFTFENILLVDSITNEPESHGFVMYDIEWLPDLTYGTTVENRAGIYFDYNQPIITNTTLNTLSKRRESIGGTLQTETGESISDVNVELIGGDTSTAILVSGEYRFDYIPTESEYTVVPKKNIDHLNGITGFDLVLIIKHILAIDSLDSPYKIIAADANNSGSLSTLDVLELRKLILFINTEFPNNESWRFIDAAYTFPNPGNPFANTFPEDVYIPDFMQDELGKDFIGVKIGDVNNSAIPSLLGGEDRSDPVDELLFKAEDRLLQKGKTYSVPFEVSNFDAVVSCQFTFEFDADQLEFVGFENGGLPDFDATNLGLAFVEDGIITFCWNGQKSEALINTALFNLKFKAKQSTWLGEVLTINSRFTKIEAYRELDKAYELLDVQLLIAGGAAEAVVFNELRVLPNQPNPFKEETVIPLYLPEAGPVSLKVYDAHGQLIKREQQNFEKGMQEFLVKGILFAKSGVYYYQIRTDTELVVGKLIVAL